MYVQVENAYSDRVYLSAQGFYKTLGLDFEWSTGRGQPYKYYTYGVGCSEVQVDCLTGDFHVSCDKVVCLCVCLGVVCMCYNTLDWKWNSEMRV